MPRWCQLPLFALLLVEACAHADAGQACQPDDQVCSFQRLKADPPATARLAAAEIVKLDDPVVRSAAVGNWLATAPRTSPADAEQLCALLTDSERRICSRRVNSPHLHR